MGSSGRLLGRFVDDVDGVVNSCWGSSSEGVPIIIWGVGDRGGGGS